jgi:hypothetical protein
MSAGPKWLVTIETYGTIFYLKRRLWREVLEIAASHGVPIDRYGKPARELQRRYGGASSVLFERGSDRIAVTNLHKSGDV